MLAAVVEEILGPQFPLVDLVVGEMAELARLLRLPQERQIPVVEAAAGLLLFLLMSPQQAAAVLSSSSI
jgi:hypothetical protein